MNNTKRVYHGSMVRFDAFDVRFVGSNFGTDEGYGIYLTEDKDFALRYAKGGYLYEIQIALANELSDTHITMTPSSIRQVLHTVPTACYETIISNYGDIAPETIKQSENQCVSSLLTYCTSDVEIVGDLINQSGCLDTILDAFYTIGYTHSYSHKGEHSICVALSTKCLKILNVVAQR